MSKENRRYTAEFKKNAVLLSYKKKSVEQAAIELDVTAKILSKWRNIYNQYGMGSFPGRGKKRFCYDNLKIFELEKEFTKLQLRLEIFQNGKKFKNQGKQSLYNFIDQNKKKYPIGIMCEVLGASTSSYNLWTQQPVAKSVMRLNLLKKEIIAIFYEFKQHSGSTMITRELVKRGFQISDTQVSFYMKQLGLRRKIKKKFKITTDSRHNMYISPNIINRQFTTDSPSKVWVSDITYIQITKSFLYLTVIIDLYDRKVVGWNLSSALSAKTTILPAWKKATNNRTVSSGLVFHSDRGVQYANKLFTSTLNEFKCIPSMSRKGCSIDNAVAESFFNSFKRELIHTQIKLLTPSEMRILIYDYIENWYNKKRRHSFLNYQTIEEFTSNNTKQNFSK